MRQLHLLLGQKLVYSLNYLSNSQMNAQNSNELSLVQDDRTPTPQFPLMRDLKKRKLNLLAGLYTNVYFDKTDNIHSLNYCMHDLARGNLTIINFVRGVNLFFFNYCMQQSYT